MQTSTEHFHAGFGHISACRQAHVVLHAVLRACFLGFTGSCGHVTRNSNMAHKTMHRGTEHRKCVRCNIVNVKLTHSAAKFRFPRLQMVDTPLYCAGSCGAWMDRPPRQGRV